MTSLFIFFFNFRKNHQKFIVSSCKEINNKKKIELYLGMGTATRRVNVLDVTIKREDFNKNSIVLN